MVSDYPPFAGVPKYDGLHSSNIVHVSYLEFSMIYKYIDEKVRGSASAGGTMDGQDRAVQHFQSRDVQNLQICKVNHFQLL